MTQRTCGHPGCNKPLRARGLCSTHYNQQHVPNRHKKKLTACVVCGTVVEKAGGGGRRYGATCSNECRRALQPKGPRLSQLPRDHWARWYGKSSAWPRYGVASCGWCGETFVKRSAGGSFCSALCSQRDARGVRLPQSELSAQVRNCTRCGADYRHQSANRVHCSDLCRDLDKDDRKVAVYHGWVRPSVRASIYERDDYQCKLCGDPVDPAANPQRDDWAPTLDHIIPRSKGGTHDESNLRTAHRWCNSVRGDRDDVELFELTA